MTSGPFDDREPHWSPDGDHIAFSSDRGHEHGIPVTSHELYPAGALGADGVEHIGGTSRRGYSPKRSSLQRSYGDVIGLLAASGMTLTPTISIGGFQLMALRHPDLLSTRGAGPETLQR